MKAAAGDDRDGAEGVQRASKDPKLNGRDPEAYLRRVLERIADYPVSCVAELLPWNLPSDAEAAAS